MAGNLTCLDFFQTSEKSRVKNTFTDLFGYCRMFDIGSESFLTKNTVSESRAKETPNGEQKEENYNWILRQKYMVGNQISGGLKKNYVVLLLLVLSKMLSLCCLIQIVLKAISFIPMDLVKFSKIFKVFDKDASKQLK